MEEKGKENEGNIIGFNEVNDNNNIINIRKDVNNINNKIVKENKKIQFKNKKEKKGIKAAQKDKNKDNNNSNSNDKIINILNININNNIITDGNNNNKKELENTPKKEEHKNIELMMSYKNHEMNDLSYDLALKHDKRSYWNFYISLIKTKHEFIYAFLFNEDKLYNKWFILY